MVRNGHPSPVRQLYYAAPAGDGAAVEVMTFVRLREINSGATQRADFCVLACIDAGTGRVMVDFHDRRLEPRSVLLIGAGAVHAWRDMADVTGELVLFRPLTPITPRARDLVSTPGGVTGWHPDPHEWRLLDLARNHLAAEANAPGSPELPAILLSALLTRLGAPGDAEGPAHPLFAAFRRSVEVNFREHHDVAFYARTLGYAPRTLTRAALRATGRSAKRYLVERLALEAQRLLVHDRFSAARCASELGFADPSNFAAFFRQATGVSPGAWQRSAGEAAVAYRAAGVPRRATNPDTSRSTP